MVVGPHQGLVIQATRTGSPAGPTIGLTWPLLAGPQLVCRDKSPAVHTAQSHLCPMGWPRLRAQQGVSSALPGLTLHHGHLSVELRPCQVSGSGLDTGSNKWLIRKHLSRARAESLAASQTGNWEK